MWTSGRGRKLLSAPCSFIYLFVRAFCFVVGRIHQSVQRAPHVINNAILFCFGLDIGATFIFSCAEYRSCFTVPHHCCEVRSDVRVCLSRMFVKQCKKAMGENATVVGVRTTTQQARGWVVDLSRYVCGGWRQIKKGDGQNIIRLFFYRSYPVVP